MAGHRLHDPGSRDRFHRLRLRGCLHQSHTWGYLLPWRNSPGATINFSGTYGWNPDSTPPEPPIQLIGVYAMLNNPNPLVGVRASSTYAHLLPDIPPSTGGSFNSQNVSPALTAPTSSGTQFYVSALPESASQGYYYPNGVNKPPYFTKVNVSTSGNPAG